MADQLTDKEIAERMDKALRRSFTMPHKQAKEFVGKSLRKPQKPSPPKQAKRAK